MKILYITRKYPPSVGGMQKMNYNLIEELAKKASLDRITWGHSQIFLPLFFVKAAIMSFIYVYILRVKYDLLFLGDAALSPVGAFFKNSIRIPTVCLAHGLDVTYRSRLYQRLIAAHLKAMDMLICVSRNTRDECVSRDVNPLKIKVIPNGVHAVDGMDKKTAIFRLREKGFAVPDRSKVLLTVGRLIERKGVAKFIEKVFLDLSDQNPSLIYIVIGTGRESRTIAGLIDKHKLGEKVFLLGRVSEDILHCAYAVSDIFVMPNVEVERDIEGFGIVALEASGWALPVIASDLQGIRDAVRDGENGFLVPPSRDDIFKQKIQSLLMDDNYRARLGESARRYSKQFSWDNIADRYIEAIKEIGIN